MKTDFLSRLYMACSEGEAGPGGITELYEKTDGAEQSVKEFDKKLQEAELPKENRLVLENLACSISMEFERQGFLNGFRLGMMLAGELEGSGK